MAGEVSKGASARRATSRGHTGLMQIQPELVHLCATGDPGTRL